MITISLDQTISLINYGDCVNKLSQRGNETY